jgi:hypothetical protein
LVLLEHLQEFLIFSSQKLHVFQLPKGYWEKKGHLQYYSIFQLKKIKIFSHTLFPARFFFCRELATPSHLGRRRFLLSSRGLRRGARHRGGRPTDCRGLPSVKEQVTTTSREVFEHGCHLRWQRSSPRPLLRCCLLTVSLT